MKKINTKAYNLQKKKGKEKINMGESKEHECADIVVMSHGAVVFVSGLS